jgi:hypothetical protein
MKIKPTILALSALCGASIIWFSSTPSVAPAAGDEPVNSEPMPLESVDTLSQGTIAPPPAIADSAADEEVVSPAEWQEIFSELLKKHGNREEASQWLIFELDQRYHEWICAKLARLSELPADDRYDALAQMESRIRSVSEAVLGHLGIAGAQHAEVLARSLEAISAEIQYAEMPGTHEARVAMLRLDREREARFEKLVAVNGSGPETEAQVLSEITPWYESELRMIVGGEESE